MIKKPSFFESYNFAYLVLFVLVACSYIPLIIYGGFGTSDDMSLIINTPDSYFEALKQSFTRSGHVSRPIYAFVQITTLFLFKDCFSLYAIYKLILWGIIGYLTSRIFDSNIKGVSKIFFLFFFSFPIFISSHFFNSFQSGYLWAVLFWLLSMLWIEGSYKSHGLNNLKVSVLFLFLSLLSCEIVFPLFILNVVYPLSEKGVKWHLKSRSNALKKYFFAVFFVLISFAIFKIFVAPLYQTEEGIYGFSISFHSLLQSLYYFFCLFVEIPLLLIELIPFYFYSPLICISFLVFPVFIFLRKKEIVNNKSKHIFYVKSSKYLLIALFSCSFIFLFSQYPAVTYGNYNKMLLPSFIIICILFSNCLTKIFNSKYWIFVPCILSLWISSMLVQIENTCKSWELRNKVSKEIVAKKDAFSKYDTKYILCDVPYYLKSNYNDEHVFWTSWDFQAFIAYKGYHEQKIFLPYCHNTLINPSIDSVNNIHNLMLDKEKAPCLNFQYSNISFLKFYESFTLLKEQNKEVKKNHYFPCFRKRLRNKMKSVFI